MALIEITDLTILRGGRRVIENFNATVKPGSITAIIGPNGSGKSSLLAAIAGDIPTSSGSITFGGRDISMISLQEQAQMRAVVLQERSYWLSYSVREVIAMGQSVQSIARIDEILKSLDMVEFADQSVTTLSGGEAQRVEIARALVRDADIYLFDEPLSAQDSASKARIITLLKKLRDEGKTILVIAHIDKRALDWCDHVIDTLAQ
jgi:ABC-type cobalamin/Fe3+-siderophores transport system ATPase subunit